MKNVSISFSALDLYLFKVECSAFRKIIQRETLPASCTDAAELAVFPLRRWVHTGRASAQYLRAMLAIRPDYIACVLLRSGSDDEIIARLRSRIEREPAFRYNN